jgi:hypothetical protein
MEQGSGVAGNPLVARAKAIVLAPKDEWPKIAAETQTPGDIFTRYVIPLAAVGPVATLIGGQVFGYGAFGFTYRPSLVAALGTAAISFLLTLVGVVVLTFIADLLAPKFGGEANRAQAFKLVAYGSTASWLAGIFGLIPSLGFFSLLGLYSIYLYYTGATPVMKVPQEKSAAYTAVTILCAILLTIIVAPITAAVSGLFFAPSIYSGADASGKISLPGGGTLDVDKAEEFGKRMEDAANGKIVPVPLAQMQALLPGSIGAYQRTATESAALGQVGGQASATYEAGPTRFTLKIVDMSAMGALAGMGAALGVEQNREDADSYERTQTIDGQIRTEAWNKTNNNGKYSIVIGNRFLVEADGGAANIDELKAAVATIDPDDLEDLVE